MHNITEKLNGNVIKYSVTFLGCDSDGVLVDGTIFIPVKNQTEFEKYLNDSEGEIFEHVDGGNVSY